MRCKSSLKCWKTVILVILWLQYILAETVKAIQAIHLVSVQPGAGNGRVTIPHTFAKSMHLHGMDPQVSVSESTNVQFSGMTPDISHLCGKQNQKPHGHHTSSTGLKR